MKVHMTLGDLCSFFRSLPETRMPAPVGYRLTGAYFDLDKGDEALILCFGRDQKEAEEGGQ